MRHFPHCSCVTSWMRIAFLASFFVIQESWGDGGAILASSEVAGTKYMLVGKPESVRVGLVDFDLVLENATTLPESIRVVLEHVDPSGPSITIDCLRAPMYNVPLYRIHANLSKEGTWKISFPANDGTMVNWRLTIAPPRPVGWSISSWILWPIPVILLFIWRAQIIRRRSLKSRGAGS